MTKEVMQQALELIERLNKHGWILADFEDEVYAAITALKAALKQPPPPVQEPVSMRMPKVGDKVICLEDESLGEVVSLTAGGSPDILFDDGSRGTYLLREFAELFGYAEQRQPLTDEQIKVIHFYLCNTVGSDYKTVARAIEAAHNIKEQP